MALSVAHTSLGRSFSQQQLNHMLGSLRIHELVILQYYSKNAKVLSIRGGKCLLLVRKATHVFAGAGSNFHLL